MQVVRYFVVAATGAVFGWNYAARYGFVFRGRS